MTISRSFENNGQFNVTDLTPQLNLVTPTWSPLGDMGLYTTRPVTQDSITFEKVEDSIQLVGDVRRGARHTVNSDDTRKLHTLPLVHFVLDDAIFAAELAGRRAYGSDSASTEAEVKLRKLESMMRKWDATHEAARTWAITQGAAYAPNGTVAIDYYAEFGVTKKSVDFVLGTGTTDIVAKNEEVIAHIQDNVNTGAVVTNIMVMASPEWFTKYINQAGVKEAYKFYSSTQEPQRNRLGEGRVRRFIHAGLEIVENRASFNGVRLVPANRAYAFPVGVEDMFEHYQGPAQTFDLVNTLGEKAYMWEYRSQRNDQITLESESNFLMLCKRPQAIVELTTSN